MSNNINFIAIFALLAKANICRLSGIGGRLNILNVTTLTLETRGVDIPCEEESER